MVGHFCPFHWTDVGFPFPAFGKCKGQNREIQWRAHESFCRVFLKNQVSAPTTPNGFEPLARQGDEISSSQKLPLKFEGRVHEIVQSGTNPKLDSDSLKLDGRPIPQFWGKPQISKLSRMRFQKIEKIGYCPSMQEFVHFICRRFGISGCWKRLCA